MKKTYKNIIEIILFLVIILLSVSIIQDLTFYLFEEALNNQIILLIDVVLTFLLISLLLKTKTGKELEKSLFENGKKNKKALKK